jgi:hypothetical protein
MMGKKKKTNVQLAIPMPKSVSIAQRADTYFIPSRWFLREHPFMHFAWAMQDGEFPSEVVERIVELLQDIEPYVSSELHDNAKAEFYKNEAKTSWSARNPLVNEIHRLRRELEKYKKKEEKKKEQTQKKQEEKKKQKDKPEWMKPIIPLVEDTEKKKMKQKKKK